MSSTKNISIRIAVVDGDKVRRELTLTGETGERALKKIKEATRPAAKSLSAINVVAEQVRNGASNLAGSIGSLGSSLSRLGPIGIGAASVLGAVTIAITKGIGKFNEAEHALNQLASALRTTDFAAGVTVKQILDLSTSLSNITMFKKEDIERAASNLTSFGNIHGEVFTRAIELSTDLAVRLGTDVPSSVEMLARALEKPEAGLGRLARKVSDLTISQKESIESFLKQGDVISAQNVILDHLESKIKGLAESQVHGLAGHVHKLSNAWNRLLESLGKVAANSTILQSSLGGLTKATESLHKAIDPSLADKKKSLEDEISRKRISSHRLKRAQEELRKINEEIDKEEQSKQFARDQAKKSAIEKLNQELLGLQKKYLKEHEDLTLSAREKIEREYTQRRSQIEALAKSAMGNEDSTSAKSALEALELTKNAKLGLLDREAALERQKAIDEINQSLLKTKPSVDLAKEALDSWRNNLIQNLGGATQENQKYLKQIEEIYNVKLKEIYDKALIDSNSWSGGAIRALERYKEAATDVSSHMESLFGTATKKIEDLLTDMISSSEISLNKLRDMAMSIKNDLVRIFVRENITGPLSGALGGFFKGMFGKTNSKVFHKGGVVGVSDVPSRQMPSHLFALAPRLHSGLMPDEFPAILQRGETVLPKHIKLDQMKNEKTDSNINIAFNISTPNAQSFTESQGQIMAMLAGEMDRYRRRNR